MNLFNTFLFIGAGSGIGRAACRLLNRDGATIVAADRNVDAAKEVANSLTGDNQFIELEVSSKQSIQNGIQNIVSKFNAPPTIIVNAVSIVDLVTFSHLLLIIKIRTESNFHLKMRMFDIFRRASSKIISF